MAVSVFKTACDPSQSGWVGSIPMHSRHSIRLDFRTHQPSVTLRHLRLGSALLVGVLLLGPVPTVGAQADSASGVRRISPADTVQPPITPKHAFLMSLFAPGSAQNVLGRNRAAAAIIGVEAMSIAMIRESSADLAEARRQLGDSLVLSYVDQNGERLATPLLARRQFADVEVQSRRSHVEDWIALLIANHLFAAADAFVAASLWDVPAHVAIRGGAGRLTVIGRIGW